MRSSYKTSLRAKGVRPVPSHNRLRSFKSGDTAITAVDWRKQVPINGAGEDVRAGIKAIAWGIGAALFVALFIIVRH